MAGSGFPAGTVIVDQCTAAAPGSPDVEVCEGGRWAEAAVAADGTVRVDLELTAILADRAGEPVDCRLPGRCLVRAWMEDPTEPRPTVGLEFAPDGPLLPSPTLVAEPDSGLTHDQTVTVTGSGFPPSTPIRMRQCGRDPQPGGSLLCEPFDHVTSRPDGTIEARGAAQALIRPIADPTESVDCRAVPTPCRIEVTPTFFGSPRGATADLHYDPDAPVPGPPTLTVVPSSGLADGRRVTVSGRDFEPLQLRVWQCAADDADRCSRFVETMAAPDGSFTAELVLRAEFEDDTGRLVDCRRPPGCALTAKTLPGLAVATSPPLGFTPAEPGERYRDRVFADVDVTTGIVYRTTTDHAGAPVELDLDVYQPAGDTEGRRPAILWFTGGGFRLDGRSLSEADPRDLARRGYVVVVPEYRVRSDADRTLAQFVSAALDAHDDALAAVDRLRDHADEQRVDADAVMAAGWDAGAVVAVDLAYLPGQWGPVGSPVAAAASVSGVILGRPDAGEPPVLALHGARDTDVPIALPTATCDAAQAAGLTCDLVVYPDDDHWLGGDDIRRRIAVFAADHLLDR